MSRASTLVRIPVGLSGDASGNIGIGTSSPAQKLEIAATSPRVRLTDTDGGYAQIEADNGNLFLVSDNANTVANSTLKLGVDGSTMLTLDSSGNLGLGVTPSAWASRTVLEVGAAGNAFVSGGAGDVYVTEGAYYNAGWKYGNSLYAVAMYNQYRGTHSWNTAASGTAGNAISFTQAMTLDASGNLLVNRTSQINTEKLGVTGYIAVKETSDSAYGFVAEASANDRWLRMGHDGTIGILETTYKTTGGASPLTLWTNAAERVRIDTSGNLGIGTTPATRLDIVGSSTATQAMRIAAGSANAVQVALENGFATRQGFIFSNNGSTGYTSFGMISENTALTFKTAAYNIGPTSDLTTGWTERARIDSSGNLLVGKTAANNTAQGAYIGSTGYSAFVATGVVMDVNKVDGDGQLMRIYRNSTQVGNISVSTGATAYNTSSDYRLKHDIAPLAGALAKVAALKPVTYKWNEDNSDGEGFIAHELAEVVPHAVTGQKDAVDADGNPIYQGIDTSFLVATLTAAIQEQQAIIESLKARLDAANL